MILLPFASVTNIPTNGTDRVSYAEILFFRIILFVPLVTLLGWITVVNHHERKKRVMLFRRLPYFSDAAVVTRTGGSPSQLAGLPELRWVGVRNWRFLSRQHRTWPYTVLSVLVHRVDSELVGCDEVATLPHQRGKTFHKLSPPVESFLPMTGIYGVEGVCFESFNLSPILAGGREG